LNQAEHRPQFGDRMKLTDYDISLATPSDIPGILVLQDGNLPDQGGALSVGFSKVWFESALADMPVIVARRDDRVVGYLVSSPFSAHAQVPIVHAMLLAYPNSPGGYLFGPICVAESDRGQGLAHALFAVLRAQLPGREGIAFIRRDNAASLKAHRKMGMQEVAAFSYGEVMHSVVAYIG
jgi:L-amino acid N-acyltransferase YncA